MYTCVDAGGAAISQRNVGSDEDVPWPSHCTRRTAWWPCERGQDAPASAITAVQSVGHAKLCEIRPVNSHMFSFFSNRLCCTHDPRGHDDESSCAIKVKPREISPQGVRALPSHDTHRVHTSQARVWNTVGKKWTL